MKKIISIILTAVLSLSTLTAVYAEKGDTMLLKTDSAAAVFNNKEIELPETVQNINNYTYVPVRAVAEKFGAEVSYNETENCITVSKDGHSADFYNSSYYQYASPYELKRGFTTENNIFMYPLREVASLVGAGVEWDSDTQSIVLEVKDYYTYTYDVFSAEVPLRYANTHYTLMNMFNKELCYISSDVKLNTSADYAQGYYDTLKEYSNPEIYAFSPLRKADNENFNIYYFIGSNYEDKFLIIITELDNCFSGITLNYSATELFTDEEFEHFLSTINIDTDKIDAEWDRYYAYSDEEFYTQEPFSHGENWRFEIPDGFTMYTENQEKLTMYNYDTGETEYDGTFSLFLNNYISDLGFAVMSSPISDEEYAEFLEDYAENETVTINGINWLKITEDSESETLLFSKINNVAYFILYTHGYQYNNERIQQDFEQILNTFEIIE